MLVLLHDAHVENESAPNHKEIMNFVFANCSKVTAIYPLIVGEIAEAQTKDTTLEKLTYSRNTNLSLLIKFKFSVKMAHLPSQLNYKSGQ